MKIKSKWQQSDSKYVPFVFIPLWITNVLIVEFLDIHFNMKHTKSVKIPSSVLSYSVISQLYLPFFTSCPKTLACNKIQWSQLKSHV